MTVDTVADDQFQAAFRRLARIMAQMTQDTGYPYDMGELAEFLQLAFEGEFGKSKTPIADVVAAIRKDGGGKNFWKKLEANQNLRRRVISLVNDGAAEWRMTLAEAAEIFGADFHPLEKAEWYFGHTLNESTRFVYETAVCPAEVIYELRGKAVLTPILKLNLLETFERVPGSFHHQPGAWFTEDRYHFNRQKPVGGYMFIGKEVWDGSYDRRWSEQQATIVHPYYVPSTAAVVQAAALHRELTGGELMFSQHLARTRDPLKAGNVSVCSGTGGLTISREITSGVAWARQFA